MLRQIQKFLDFRSAQGNHVEHCDSELPSQFVVKSDLLIIQEKWHRHAYCSPTEEPVCKNRVDSVEGFALGDQFRMLPADGNNRCLE